MKPESKPLLVYVHIPFCPSKCHFCDWVTEIPTAQLLLDAVHPVRSAYIKAIIRQIRHFGPGLRDKGYRTAILYWGGGTANLLEPQEMNPIMEALQACFELDALQEATMECGPESITPEKLRLYREWGFNRLSVGVQSLNGEVLERLGRSHDPEAAEAALWAAREAGFDQVNVDIISGFPMESREAFIKSVERLLDLPFSHVSLYPFRPVTGTVMFRQMARGRLEQSPLKHQVESYRAGRRLLTNNGYPEYALSHFGHDQCHSDMAYFTLGMDWVGFGSGATSLLGGRYSAFERGRLSAYIADPLTPDQEVAAAEDSIASRLIYQALTTRQGVSRTLWENRLERPLEEILAQPAVNRFLGYFGYAGFPLEKDDRGLRLPFDDLADAFIRLLHQSQPNQNRRPRNSGVRAQMGAH